MGHLFDLARAANTTAPTRRRPAQHRVRLGQAPLRAGDRYRPDRGCASERIQFDCLRRLPMAASAARDHQRSWRAWSHRSASTPYWTAPSTGDDALQSGDQRGGS